MVNHLKNPVERMEAIEDLSAAIGDLHFIERDASEAILNPLLSRFEGKLDELKMSASRWKDALGFQLSVIRENPYSESKVRDACTALYEISSDIIDLADSLPGPLRKFREDLKELAVRLASACSVR